MSSGPVLMMCAMLSMMLMHGVLGEGAAVGHVLELVDEVDGELDDVEEDVELVPVSTVGGHDGGRVDGETC